MPLDRTLAIIKPDATEKNLEGLILDIILKKGFTVRAMKQLRLTPYEAGIFYGVHAAKSWFGELCEFMSSGDIFVLVLEKENAIASWREVLGATNPALASEGTIRHLYGTALDRNICHGSDAPDTAAFEIGFFFSGLECARSSGKGR